MIEELTLDDTSAAVALWEQAGLTRPWNDAAADFRRAVTEDSSVVLGIRAADQLLAAVMVGDDGHRGWVYYLAVADSARGTGLGRQLMEAAEAWLKQRNCPKVQFMVRSDNTTVLSFYDHLGYSGQDCMTLGRRLDR